jgi:hypothetical protein
MHRVGFEPTTTVLERGEECSCLRPHGHCDHHSLCGVLDIITKRNGAVKSNYVLEMRCACLQLMSDRNCFEVNRVGVPSHHVGSVGLPSRRMMFS